MWYKIGLVFISYGLILLVGAGVYLYKNGKDKM